MVPWARSPSSLSSTAAGRVWQRGVRVYSPPRGLRSIAPDNATGIGGSSSLRQMRCLAENGGRPPRLSGLRSLLVSANPSRASVERAEFRYMRNGMNQARSFGKINNFKATDSHKTEELFQRVETKEDEEDTRLQRQVLNEEGKKSQSTAESDKQPHSMTKGKLLTTPSRLFKLVIPLTTIVNKIHDKGIEPIALLFHPQQPLSYLERLIQLELPSIKGENGKQRAPAISFIVLQHDDSAIKPRQKIPGDLNVDAGQQEAELNEGVFDSEKHPGSGVPAERRRRSREEDAETYSYPRRTSPEPNSDEVEAERFVRWSQATEVGDFIRDAARAREFIISIEGAPSGLSQIRVGVPSFDERTYFLRLRLRKVARRIKGIAEIKHECDTLAHRGAQRVAIGGFGILSSWWYIVYRLTFETDLGWDTMEPVTYLVSLSTLMGGYLWFLYHNREISYRSALDFTISARQKKLYQQHNVDLQLWESLIDEGNALRREIKNIATEYDAEWNERADEQDESVTEALKSERRHKNGKSQDKDGKDDKDGGDDD